MDSASAALRGYGFRGLWIWTRLAWDSASAAVWLSLVWHSCSGMDLAWTRFIFGSYLDSELMGFSFLDVARISSVLFAGFWGSHADINRHVGIDGDL